MKIYIASSWKNEHAVVMLTEKLKDAGHDILSFVENNHGEKIGSKDDNGNVFQFEDWMLTDLAEKSFKFDTHGAVNSDIVIYISPAGNDAWAEVGAAWACDVPILGLWAKGEQSGLMRKMVTWFTDVSTLMQCVTLLESGKITKDQLDSWKERR